MDHIRRTIELDVDDLEATIHASYEDGIAIVENVLTTIDKHTEVEIIGIGTIRYVEIYHLLRERGRQFSNTGLVEWQTVAQLDTLRTVSQIDLIWYNMRRERQ